MTACNPFSAFAVTLEPVALAVQRVWVQKAGGSGSGGSSGEGLVPYSVRALIRLGKQGEYVLKIAVTAASRTQIIGLIVIVHIAAIEIGSGPDGPMFEWRLMMGRLA
jgi:hypothetical protein